MFCKEDFFVALHFILQLDGSTGHATARDGSVEDAFQKV